jgi:ribosomal protein S18 acetylase RimI-like enzyme
MAMTIETTLLATSAVDAAAAVQGRAFFDDPLFEFVFPDAGARRDQLPWLMRIGIAIGMSAGHVHTTGGEMLGNAVWLAPGQTNLSDERLAEAGFVEPEQRMGEVSLARFGAFMEQAGATHERLMPEPHWYLLILGVDPPYQGRGVGGSLIQPTLMRADMERLPCYLETGKERNLAFYRKHGFDVADEQAIAGGGPTVWAMIRRPRAV